MSQHLVDNFGNVRILFRLVFCGGAFMAAVLICLAPRSVRASETSAGDRIKAEALYKRGRALLKAGDFKGGCPKFDAAQQLYARATTTINIARCHTHFGKISAAIAAYRDALRLIGDSPLAQRQAKRLRQLATAEMTAVESRLAYLQVRLKTAPKGVQVMDGDRQMLAAMLGESMPVDPGEHRIVATAPGHRRSEKLVTLHDGEVTEVVLSLEPLAAAPEEAAASRSPERATPIWPWIVGAGGVALLGVGVGFKIDSAAADDLLVERCPLKEGVPTCDPASGYDPTADNARKNRGHALFVGMTIGGGLALGAAITGLVLAPVQEAQSESSWRLEPQCGPSLAAARLTVPF